MRKYPVILQEGLKDCGVSCLLMIMKTYGGEASIEYLRELTNTTKDGVNAKSLIDAATKLNFQALGVNGNIEELTDEMLPCIAHVIIDKKYKHFIVIYKKKKNKLLICDPRVGLKTISFDEFKTITTNNYIILKPTKKIPILTKENKFKKIIIKNIIESKKLFINILLLSFIYTLLNILLSFNFKFIIDYGIEYQSKINIYTISFILIFLILIKELSNYLRNIILNSINHKLDLSLMKNIYNHILSLPYPYYRNRTTGEIISRMQDMSSIKELISKVFITLFIDSILVISVLYVLFKINIELTLIILLITVLYFIILVVYRKILKNYIFQSKEKSSIVNSYLVETISGIETIKGLNKKELFIKKFNNKYYDYIKLSNDYNKIFLTEHLLKEIIQLIGVAVIIMLGSTMIIDNKITLTSLITYHSLIFYFLEPIRNIINSDIIYRESVIALKRIIELYEIKSEDLNIEEKTGQALLGNIKINNLNYSYNGRNNILNKMNIDIKQGDKVLLYGESGNGKSTIARILMKYMEVDKEMVFIDDLDINNYNLFDLRNNICYISQNETIFTDTIYNNVVLDKKEEMNLYKEVESMCMVKDIYKNNILAYDMLIEENGFNLSGGERQRIILSRALMQDKNIYILDESLSEIDINKERLILSNIFNKYKDKTIIVISHRFNNNDLFNKKLEIKDGYCYER